MTASRRWVAVGLALILAGCGGSGSGSGTPTSGGGSGSGTPTSGGVSGSSAVVSAAATPTTPIDITDIGQLRTAFNQHAGQPRLIVLMSPT